MLLLGLISLTASAQSLVSFVLTPEGKYLTPEGEDFVIVPFEGKTASEIYLELLENISAVSIMPFDIIESINPSLLMVEVKSDDIIRNRTLGKSYPMEGSYRITIKVKDGRIRVSAPDVSPYAGKYRFDWFVKNHFNKKGEFKDGNRRKDFEEVQARLNSEVNLILNLKAAVTQKNEEEDW